MKGTYIMGNGEKVEVLNFDAENNIVYVNFKGEKKWVGQCNYMDWKPENEAEVEVTETISEPPVVEEKVKKPRKKKDATN